MARRDSEDVAAGIRDFAKLDPPTLKVAASGLGAFEKLADVPIVSGNDAELLIDGKPAFDTMFAAMTAARTTILAQFHIIKDDDLARAFRDVLIAQAKRGVKVRLLYDAVGCAKRSKTCLSLLAVGGARIVNVHELRGPMSRFQLNFHNHRKTGVIDGEIGFIGGLNVGAEYVGRDPKFGNWHDTHVRIIGLGVSQLQLVFVEDWHWATAENLIPALNWRATRAEANGDALIVATGPGDPMATGSLYFCAAIDAARERFWIAPPYFVPDGDVMTSLKLAAIRGVDVRILAPDQIDHTIVWLAAFSYFDELLAVGAQIWRLDDGFMHQKVLVVDRRIASVGATNLENRSRRLDFEVTAVFFDDGAANNLVLMLEGDFARPHRMTRKLSGAPARIRYGEPVARLFAPPLRRGACAWPTATSTNRSASAGGGRHVGSST